MDFALRPQLPLVAVRYATPERRDRQRKASPSVCCCCCCSSPCFSRVSARHHGSEGRESTAGRRPSLDVFRQSCCSLGARNLLRPGWDPLPVRHHPDRALLQGEDLQRQRGQRWKRNVKAECGRGHLHGSDSSQAGHIRNHRHEEVISPGCSVLSWGFSLYLNMTHSHSAFLYQRSFPHFAFVESSRS